MREGGGRPCGGMNRMPWKGKKRGSKGPKSTETGKGTKNESELIQSSSTLQAFASGSLFKRRVRQLGG